MSTTISIVVDDETIGIDSVKGLIVKSGVFESLSNKSTDGTLADNSTALYPSQSAVRTYVGNKEDKSNKSTDGTLADNSTALYPSQSAVRTYVDSAVGAIDISGKEDTSNKSSDSEMGGAFPSAYLYPNQVSVHDYVQAELSSALTVKEDLTNKSTDGTLADNSTALYPSQSAVRTYIDGQSRFRGAWMDEQHYIIGDTVTYTDGKVYLCIAVPELAIVPTNTDYWKWTANGAATASDISNIGKMLVDDNDTVYSKAVDKITAGDGITITAVDGEATGDRKLSISAPTIATVGKIQSFDTYLGMYQSPTAGCGLRVIDPYCVVKQVTVASNGIDDTITFTDGVLSIIIYSNIGNVLSGIDTSVTDAKIIIFLAEDFSSTGLFLGELDVTDLTTLPNYDLSGLFVNPTTEVSYTILGKHRYILNEDNNGIVGEQICVYVPSGGVNWKTIAFTEDL